MKKLRWVLLSVAAFTFLAIFTSPAQAVMLKLTLQQLSGGADSIVVGTVTGQSSQWNASHTHIETSVAITVEETLKGVPKDKVTVTVLGGEAGGITERVTDVPRFQTGERLVVFLKQLPDKVEVFGYFQGKLNLEPGEPGARSLAQIKKDITETVKGVAAPQVPQSGEGFSTVPDSFEAARSGSQPVQKAPATRAEGWQTLTSADFESGFPLGWSVSGATTWGITSYKAYAGANSVWCAANTLNPATSSYPPNMNAWMKYGPFDLSDATAAELSFAKWVKTPNVTPFNPLSDDCFKVYLSIDNSNFYYYYWYGTFDSWQTHTYDLTSWPGLGNLIGKPQVWLAFRFQSNSDGVVDQGAYVDNIVLRKYTGVAPQISSIAPGTASAGTGTQVTISGTGFGAAQGTVNFFYRTGQPYITGSVVSWTDTSIVATVPTGIVNDYPASASSGPVYVTNAAGVDSNPYPFTVTFGYGGVKWAGTNPVVNFYVNPNTTDCESEEVAVHDAADTWNAVPNKSFTFNYAGVSIATHPGKNNKNEIMWYPMGPPSTEPLAQAAGWFSGNTLIETDIVFNDDNTSYTWSTGATPGAQQYDVQSVALHELGHWLCLNDLYGNITSYPQDVNKVMYGFGSIGATKRVLDAADVAGMQWIYPQADDTTPPTVTATTPASNATSVPVSTNIDITFSEAMNQTPTQGAFSISPNVAGAFSWSGNVMTFNPTADLAYSTTYTVTIGTGAKDIADNAMAALYTLSFTTAAPPDTVPPTITSTTPANNATGVPVNTNIDVTFSEGMLAGATESAFSISPNVAGAFGWAGNVMTFNPTTDLAYSTNYSVTIGTGAQDLAGNAIATPHTFSFTTAAPPDTVPPTVTATTPANNATGVPVTTNIDVTFSEAMKQAETQTAFSISPTVAGVFSWAGNVMTFNPTADLAYSTTYTVTIGTDAQDLAGNTLPTPYVFSFTTAAPPDTVPPTITSTTPANNATGVPITANIDVTFSEAMKQAETQTAFSISPTVAGVFSWAGNVMTFNPTTDLAYSTNYTVTIGTGAQDLAGNAIAAPHTFSFTTAAPPDTVPPTITSTTPANNATGVPITTNIDITFSEAMKQFETQGAFSINPAVGGAFSWAGNVMTFNPDADLAYSTAYTVTIGTGALDLAGNPIAAPYTFSFTTAAPPDTVPPTITSTTPANNATNVPITNNTDLTFSEAMKQAETQAAFSISPTITDVFSWSGNTMTFNPTTDLAYSTNYTVTIGTGAQDIAGNAIAAPYTFIFTTAAPPDVTPPTVTATTPANNATNVSITTNTDVTFSEVMKQAETQTAFSISPTVAGVFSWAGNTMTFNPTTDLAYSTNYTVTIGTGAQDIAGNAMTAPYTFSFTTVAPPDTVPPTVTATTPLNNATNVSITTNTDVTFSEVMKQTETQAAFSISPTITGTFSWAGNVMTFNPTADLAYSTAYAVSIGTGALDLAGNPIAAPYTFSFTTAAPPDVTPPTVTATTPANNATNVSITTNTDVTFSEVMKQTETQTTFSINPLVPGVFSWSGDVMTFNPTADLAYSTAYAVSIGTGAKDIAGNAMVSPYTFTFTTGAMEAVRNMPATIGPGQTFDVTVTFSSPANDFNAIGMSDTAPSGWTAVTNTTWCNPAAMESRVNANTAEYIWGGPYNQGTVFTALYRVTVPAGVAAGTYSFTGTLQYYIGQMGPLILNLVGKSQIEVIEGARIQGETWEVKGAVLGGVTLTLDGTTTVTSSEQGVYQLTVLSTGPHTVVASKTGFRSLTRTVNVENLGTVITLDFKANFALVPNAPNLTYVLACVNKWKFPPAGLGLNLTKVLSVINAWKFPV